ncbi:MAG TPA: SPOR domain-containing protein, partial [Burkholderiales bacterium]|nr:SPOR domain-containing protein [Burkholderiales bacterium]
SGPSPFAGSGQTASPPPKSDTSALAKKAPQAEEKSRFDFYEILPGSDGLPAPSRGTREPVIAKPEIPALKPEPAPIKPEPPKPLAKAEPFSKMEPFSKPEPSTKVEPLARPETAKLKDTFYIQAGAFQNPTDADNLRARLALMGLETQVQAAMLSDKQRWHRVRLGPYSRPEDVERVRSMLKQNGIEGSLIRVREGR